MADDGIPDPVLNCLLEVCCLSAQAEAGLAEAMIAAEVCDKKDAPKCAAWIHEYFDLAPKGSLVEFKAVITRLARG
jgi:hypothetical protein